MNKLYCLIMFILSNSICAAQNLVPNGDFEQYSGCPTAGGGNWIGQLDSALFWINPAPWPPGGSPDYYNQCAPGSLNVPNAAFGYQQAHSGGAYCGIGLWSLDYPDFREYIEAPLTSILVANNCYHFEMFMSHADNMQYITDDIQIYFSDTAITGINNWNTLPYIAQLNNSTGNIPDTANWTLFSGNYTASGGERYLLIGNFKIDAATDTTLVNNLAQWPEIYIYIDDVSLTPCTGINENDLADHINIFPNPFTTILNVSVNSSEISEIVLFDIGSRKILQNEFNKSFTLETHNLSQGIYIYEVRNKMGVLKKGKIVKI